MNAALNLSKTEHLLLRMCPQGQGDWIYFVFSLTFAISEDDVRLSIIQRSKGQWLKQCRSLFPCHMKEVWNKSSRTGLLVP